MKVKEMTCSNCKSKTSWKRSSNMNDSEMWFRSVFALGFGHMVRRYWWICMGCNKTIEQ